MNEDPRYENAPGSLSGLTDENDPPAEIPAGQDHPHQLVSSPDHTSVLENTPVLVAGFDSFRHVKIWNEPCERLLGWTTQEITACPDPFDRIFLPRPSDGGIFHSEEWTDGRFRETTVRARDGRCLSQRWAFHRLHDGTVIGLGYDSSELTRVEEELSRSEEMLRIFVQNVPAAIAMLDRSMTYLAASRHYCASLRLDPDQIIGRSHYDLLPDIKPAWYEEHRRALAGEIRRGEESWVRADGQTEWLWWELRPWRDEKGEIGGLLTSGEIITRQKKLEAELREAKIAAENASRAKSEFLANISHELRTPLSSIFGLTEMTLASRLNQEQRTNLEMVKESAGALLQIINDLLDISRIEALEMSFQTQLFGLRQTVSAIIDPFRPLARRKGLRLQLRIPPTIPHSLVGDPDRVGQVLRNLLSNAIKFTRHGSVTIQIKEMDSQTGTTGLLFRIRDTGIGIDPVHHSRLFQNFSQIHSSYDKEFGGTGLGLAISKKLVEAMGGTIWFESDGHSGSTFFFKLAFLHPPKPTHARTEPAEANSAGSPAPFVLLAEDNAPSRRYLLHFLQQAGFHVISAQSGYEVLSILARTPVDLVMMDMQMPGMDGLNATRRIRESTDPRIRTVPIIAVTAYARPEDQQRFLAAGVNKCLAKPVHIPLLIEEILILAGGTPRSTGPADPVEDSRPFNVEELKTRWRKHPDLMHEICTSFVKEAPELVRRLEKAAAAEAWPSVAEAAHLLQNLAAMFPLPNVIRISRAIEDIAVGGEKAAVKAQIHQLMGNVRMTRKAIARILTRNAGSLTDESP
ncbi:MAG: response regulator [Acidobacteria bacterium]|nr:response regulator [Acidobacteriota bacterium]